MCTCTDFRGRSQLLLIQDCICPRRLTCSGLRSVEACPRHLNSLPVCLGIVLLILFPYFLCLLCDICYFLGWMVWEWVLDDSLFCHVHCAQYVLKTSFVGLESCCWSDLFWKTFGSKIPSRFFNLNTPLLTSRILSPHLNAQLNFHLKKYYLFSNDVKVT